MSIFQYKDHGNNPEERNYKIIHIISKAIICFVIICINYYMQGFTVEGNLTAFITVLWFFGVNCMAFLLENIFRKKHKHDIL